MVRIQHLFYIAAVLVALFLLWFAAIKVEQLRLSRIMQLQLEGRSAELDRQLNQLSVLPRVLAKHPHIANILQEQSEPTLNDANLTLLDSQIDSDSSFAFVMDEQGTTVASSNFQNAVSFVGVNYGFRPYFQQALSDDEATFFAVGATTGIPGYFASSAVKHEGENQGVLVVKAELAGLLDSWNLQPYEWLAVDELGIVILSTNKELLYVPTRELKPSELQTIEVDRRYVPKIDAKMETLSPIQSRFVSTTARTNYFVQQHSLSVQDWRLMLVVDQSQVWFRAMLYVLAVGSIITVVLLGFLNYLTQKRLIATEHRHAVELEMEVEERTKELRNTQEELITESNYAMLGRMSGAINHEINQPLASLRLNLASLRKVISSKDTDMDEVRQIVVDSDRTTKRIGRVVTSLRSLAGRNKTRFSTVIVHNLVSDIVETVHRERPSLSQSLQHSPVSDQLRVNGNETLLQQALLNMLYNAFDAVMNVDEPEVIFSVDEQEDNVIFSVVDNGAGVAKEVEPILFKPFASDTNKTTGMGLGLTLAKMIAEEHGGELNYVRRVDNKTSASLGSQFTLVIPRML